MKKFSLCFTIFFLVQFSLSAQQNFDPGYIVRSDKDTVKGFVQSALESELTHTVKFKKELNAPVQEFTPDNLAGFGMDKEVYKSLYFLNTSGDTVSERAFVKLLVTGEYNLYNYRTASRDFFILQKDTTIHFLYDRETGVSGEIKKEGNYLNYLNLISVFCPKLAGHYDQVQFNNQSMTDFVYKVDNCSGQETAKSYFQKSKTVMKPIVFVGGLPVSGNSQFTASLVLQFTLPKVDSHLAFNIGVNYSNTTYTSTQRAYPSNQPYSQIKRDIITSVPFTIQYYILITRVRPYFLAGFSGAYVQETNNSANIPGAAAAPSPYFSGALVGAVGIEARIVSELYARAEWRYELFLEHPAIGLSYHF